MKHLGDITKLSGYTVPVVDVITGGSPCQDLSVAGKRAGLDGERSGLFMEQIRIVKEMRQRDRDDGRADELLRPRYMVWENVPGAFSSNGGGQTSKLSSPKLSASQSQKLPMCLCLTKQSGANQDVSTMTWADGALLGEYTMHSFGESPREENASRLSQILEGSPHPKYSLSAKACQGILNRAAKRGKALPEVLREALEIQRTVYKETE